MSKIFPRILLATSSNEGASSSISFVIVVMRVISGLMGAGGLISVADEYQNKEYNHDKVKAEVAKIKERLEKIFDLSQKIHRLIK